MSLRASRPDQCSLRGKQEVPQEKGPTVEVDDGGNRGVNALEQGMKIREPKTCKHGAGHSNGDPKIKSGTFVWICHQRS